MLLQNLTRGPSDLVCQLGLGWGINGALPTYGWVLTHRVPLQISFVKEV